jgi:uncharacterized repeat protein (TIGR03803 family)
VSFDAAGNLYSTALAGFAGGTFQLNAKKHAEHNFLFNFTDGQEPASGVIVHGNTVYGTTAGGGANNWGTVYEIDSSGNETVLYSFCQQTNCNDGAEPYGSLYMDGAGNLYGTTKIGGANNLGVVFEIVQSLPKQEASPIWRAIPPSRE